MKTIEKEVIKKTVKGIILIQLVENSIDDQYKKMEEFLSPIDLVPLSIALRAEENLCTLRQVISASEVTNKITIITLKKNNAEFLKKIKTLFEQREKKPLILSYLTNEEYFNMKRYISEEVFLEKNGIQN